MNRTRDLPACSVVPQPTALPRTPEVIAVGNNDFYTFNISVCYNTMDCWCAGSVIQLLIFALIREENVLLCTELYYKSEL